MERIVNKKNVKLQTLEKEREEILLQYNVWFSLYYHMHGEF